MLHIHVTNIAKIGDPFNILIRNQKYLFICTCIYVYKVMSNNCKPFFFLFLVMDSPAVHLFISGTKKCYFSNLSINRTFDEYFVWQVCALINHIFFFSYFVVSCYCCEIPFIFKKQFENILVLFKSKSFAFFLLLFHASTFVSIKTFPYISWTFHNFPQIEINIYQSNL